jgi:hypothetical protein
MDVTEVTRTLLNTTQVTVNSVVLLVVTPLPAVGNPRTSGPSCNNLRTKYSLTILRKQLEGSKRKITFSGGPYQRELHRLCDSPHFAGE